MPFLLMVVGVVVVSFVKPRASSRYLVVLVPEVVPVLVVQLGAWLVGGGLVFVTGSCFRSYA